MNESVVSKITSDKEAFDFIKNHLLKQNEKAESGGYCLYATHLKETQLEVYNQVMEETKGLSSSDFSDDYDFDEVQGKLLEEIDYNSFCAIGCLFSTDKNFIRTQVGLLEGEMISGGSSVLEGIIRLYPEWCITNDSISMLKSLQFIHDSKDPEEWNNIIFSIERCFTNDDSPEFIAKDIVQTEYGDQISNYINR